ncbi:chromate transporter [Corallococcus exercitus]|uniref:chromate transporter n=1 Tax=Corallococcus exercitus TaxID=2316736 RepID=UPI00300CC248
MMEDELVRRRQWLPREEFLDLLGATHLIPGPNSTELAIHLGHRRAGWPGLVVAGVCFIVPAMLLTLAAAWAYVRFGPLPQAGALRDKPVYRPRAPAKNASAQRLVSNWCRAPAPDDGGNFCCRFTMPTCRAGTRSRHPTDSLRRSHLSWTFLVFQPYKTRAMGVSH